MLKASEVHHEFDESFICSAKISVGRLCLLENDDTISVALLVILVIESKML